MVYIHKAIDKLVFQNHLQIQEWFDSNKKSINKVTPNR